MATSIDQPPRVVSPAHAQAFDRQARQLGLRPDDKWIGGYVDYEWDHLRHVLATLPVAPAELEVLEFGCNVGASAILFAHLGARVTAVDIDRDWLDLARLNAARYGCDNIAFDCAPDSTRLPYPDGSFDLIACNSVLEYVAPVELGAVQRELDRVLRPGGLILLTGTSSRLWPREGHTRRWLVNYVPRRFDGFFAQAPARGISPWRARHGFGRHYENLDRPGMDACFARSRLAMGSGALRLRLQLGLASLLGVGPGLLGPYMSCLLKKKH
ncbi:MAG: class I SAM-dependent methyltransferase [Massilia sp.]